MRSEAFLILSCGAYTSFHHSKRKVIVLRLHNRALSMYFTRTMTKILFFCIPRIKYCFYSLFSGSKTQHVIPPRNSHWHVRFPTFFQASAACVLQPSLFWSWNQRLSTNRRLRERRTYLGARIKNDIPRRAVDEQRLSALLSSVHGQYMAKYVVLHFRSERRRSSTARRDTSFFILALRYVILHPRSEIRRSSSSRRDTSFFIRAPRYVLFPLICRNNFPPGSRNNWILPSGAMTAMNDRELLPSLHSGSKFLARIYRLLYSLGV